MTIKLPPKPKPDIFSHVVTTWRDGVECEIDKGPRYTVEQMEAYAREAVRLNMAPLSDEQLREALRQCPYDTVENLRVRWLYAKDFARAIEAAHGIQGD